MISKDKIIQKSLLKVGEVSDYNDNGSDTYKIASFLLDSVIDNVASRNDFLFNANTVELTKTGKKGDEFVYNIPVDFLNKIMFVNGLGRIEGEFIYSETDNLKLQYCRKIDISDFPDYLFDYMVYATSVELAETYNQYTDRLGLLNTRLETEKNNVYKIEFRPMIREV